MLRAVVWKELREQWVIAATLLVVGGGLLVAAAMLGEPPVSGAPAGDVVKSLGLGRLATLMLVVTAGMVCGGALFAAEREAGTITFLEVLPTMRRSIWAAKVAAGLTLALGQAGLLLTLAAAMGVADVGFAVRLAVYALLAFAWGTLGSTVARTTLGSVGVAIPAATLATFVILLPVCLVFAPPGSSMPRPIGWVVFEALMLLTPLLGSAWRFTAPDRARATGLARRGAGGTRALVWLAVRQVRATGLVLSAFALAFGFALLAPDVQAVFVWPALALTAGVLAGVTAFGDEQAHRVAPFWAEGRLPLNRAWAVKVGLHLALVAWLLALLALPSAVRAQFEQTLRFSHGRSSFAAIFRDRLFEELGSQSWKYLLLPAAYGFAAGHVCGLLFRKPVVACGVAMMLGGALSALWLPSLLAGGLSHWQVWLPPAVLLATGLCVVRAWSADRLHRRGPLWRLAGGAGGAVAAFAVGLGFRVLEVPDRSDAAADVAFVDTLPTYDENLGGREFRAAAERFARTAATATQEVAADARTRSAPDRLDVVFRTGWPPPADADFLDRWLDRVFADAEWPALAADAAARPLGVYEPPQLTGTPATTAAALDNARRMAVALMARTLQRQAHESDAFPRAYRTVLALSRTVRNGGGVLALAAGSDIERVALLAAERWLERYRGPAAPLRDAAREVARADAPGDLDPDVHFLADRYVLRERLRAPAQWLGDELTVTGQNPEQAAPKADLVAFGWTVPWERERTRRLLGLGFERGAGGATGSPALLTGRPGAGLMIARNRSADEMVEADRYLRVTRRAMALKLAVCAYQTDRKATPAALDDVVAGGYLDAIPEDPYAAGRPFGYRVSAGESLRGPARAPGRATDDTMILTAGWALVWSVGTDGVDQGGRVMPGGPRAEDLVFLVPPLPKD